MLAFLYTQWLKQFHVHKSFKQVDEINYLYFDMDSFHHDNFILNISMNKIRILYN